MLSALHIKVYMLIHRKDIYIHTVLYQIEQLSYIIAFFTSDIYGLIMATL